MFKRGLPPGSVWDRFQRREWIAVLFPIASIIGIVVFSDSIFRAYGNSPIFSALIAVIWMIVTLALGYGVSNFRCPRCGQPFFRTWWYHNGFARKCVHCGLPKWSPGKAG